MEGRQLEHTFFIKLSGHVIRLIFFIFYITVTKRFVGTQIFKFFIYFSFNLDVWFRFLNIKLMKQIFILSFASYFWKYLSYIRWDASSLKLRLLINYRFLDKSFSAFSKANKIDSIARNLIWTWELLKNRFNAIFIEQILTLRYNQCYTKEIYVGQAILIVGSLFLTTRFLLEFLRLLLIRNAIKIINMASLLSLNSDVTKQIVPYLHQVGHVTLSAE